MNTFRVYENLTSNETDFIIGLNVAILCANDTHMSVILIYVGQSGCQDISVEYTIIEPRFVRRNLYQNRAHMRQ